MTHELPRQIVESLIILGLKTETGSALLTGYRLGNKDLSPEKGDLQLAEAKASVTFRDSGSPTEN